MNTKMMSYAIGGIWALGTAVLMFQTYKVSKETKQLIKYQDGLKKEIKMVKGVN